MRAMRYGLGVMAAVVSMAGSAYAGVAPSVPEIGPGSITAAMGLLSAGILVLRARRK